MNQTISLPFTAEELAHLLEVACIIEAIVKHEEKDIISEFWLQRLHESDQTLSLIRTKIANSLNKKSPDFVNEFVNKSETHKDFIRCQYEKKR